MHPTPEEYQAVIQDIARLLENEPDDILDHFEDEPDPRRTDLMYTTTAGQDAPNAVPPTTTPAAVEQTAEAGAGKAPSMAELSERFSLKRASTIKAPDKPRAPQTEPTAEPAAQAAAPQPAAAQPPPRGPLEPNMACTLCSDRIYPVRRYRVPGTNPILVLHYNGPVRGSENRVDRSMKHVLGSAEEDDLFGQAQPSPA